MATPDPQATPFGAKRALGVFFAYLGFQLAFGMAAGLVVAVMHGVRVARGAAAGDEMLRNAVIWGTFAGVAGAGAMACWMTWYMVGRSTERLRPFGWTRAGARAALIGAGVGVGCAILFLIASAAFPPPPDFRPGPMRSALQGGGRAVFYAWAVLAVAIAPPVEEFVFRGVLWTGLRESWGPWPAAIAVTALFVALHLVEAWRYPPALAAIGAMGVLALLMRVRHGSLVPAIFVHVAYNAVVVSASLAP